jgi:hypothetical protein
MSINAVPNLRKNENDDGMNNAQSYAEWIKTKWD